jgi:transposase
MAREAVLHFPPTLDEYITADNPVRVIDAFVDQLDLQAIGFKRAIANPLGRPAYAPGDLLKLYLYGYLNRIRSSRLLEREARRNVEVMWLLKKLTPDFKTIADFRKDHPHLFKPVFREFTLLCKELGLFGGELVAVDGSKFKAVNNKDRNFTPAKLQRLLGEIETKIDAYVQQLEQSDQLEEGDSNDQTHNEPSNHTSLNKVIAHLQRLQERRGRYRVLLKTLQESGETQLSLTDPDSRSMPKNPKVPVGYNVQVAVDGRHSLIVEQQVTNAVTDQDQLSPVALAAHETLQERGPDQRRLEVVADRGYYHGAQVKLCEEAGITCYIAKPLTSANAKRGLFSKEAFTYQPEKDCYICPAGQALPFHFETVESNRRIRYYWTTACRTCPLKSQCTREPERRRISRWVDEHLLEAMQERVRAHPEKMQMRKQIVEHLFGTLKHWWGHSHFLMRGLKKVSGEFSLTALVYNLRRVLNIVGVKKLLEVLKSRKKRRDMMIEEAVCDFFSWIQHVVRRLLEELFLGRRGIKASATVQVAFFTQSHDWFCRCCLV